MFSHTTKIKVDLKVLREVTEELRKKYEEVNTRETHEGRSRFNSWNNIAHFLKRIDLGKETITLDMTGTAKGSSARVYYQPSVTSLAKPVRKAIIPTNPDKVFLFFDLKAAEFFLNCYFCNETEALKKYADGKDIYMHYANLFPQGTERKVIKEVLIANMYGVTPYRVAKNLGITDTVAERLLDTIGSNLVSMTMNKNKIIRKARSVGYYGCPNGFDSNNWVKVADFDPVKGFNPLLALSCAVQSALGMWMQSLIRDLEKRVDGTIIQVFDSVLIEIHPSNVERCVEYLKKRIYPFRADQFSVGKTFYEAQEEPTLTIK